MRPVLVELGPLSINSWGVMAAVAFAAGAWVIGRELERHGERRERALPLALAAALGGLIGARLYFLAEHPSQITELAGILSGEGFTWYGGALGGAAAVLLTARRRAIPTPVVLGTFAPALALGYAIGRIGCQLAGDGTYGVASDLPWAMSYPDGVIPTTEQVHPTPIYETLASLAIFAVLWRVRRGVSPVALFGAYLALSGVERVLVEFVRRNDAVVASLTQPQLFGATALLAGLVILGASNPKRVLPQPA